MQIYQVFVNKFYSTDEKWLKSKVSSIVFDKVNNMRQKNILPIQIKCIDYLHQSKLHIFHRKSNVELFVCTMYI